MRYLRLPTQYLGQAGGGAARPISQASSALCDAGRRRLRVRVRVLAVAVAVGCEMVVLVEDAVSRGALDVPGSKSTMPGMLVPSPFPSIRP